MFDIADPTSFESDSYPLETEGKAEMQNDHLKKNIYIYIPHLVRFSIKEARMCIQLTCAKVSSE